MDCLIRKIMLLILIILFFVNPFNNINAQPNQDVPKPIDFFGFEPGNDRNLFDYEKLIEYT